MLGEYQYDGKYLLVYYDASPIIMYELNIQDFDTVLQMRDFIKEENILSEDIIVCCKVDRHFSLSQLLKTL